MSVNKNTIRKYIAINVIVLLLGVGLISLVLGGCAKEEKPVTDKKKEEIHGPVYDAVTVAKILGIQYSEEELKSFGDPPRALLGHVTFFDPGLSILQLRDAVRNKGNIFQMEEQEFLGEVLFTNITDAPRYVQLRMHAAPNSSEKTLEEQKLCLLPDEEIPHVRQVATGMVIHFLKSGERLYETWWLRCVDKISYNRGTAIGVFDHHGLMISAGRWDDMRRVGFGLATIKK